MLTINDKEFQRLVKFVHQNYGIDLSKKRQLITGRLSNTIVGMGFNSFEDYVEYLINNGKPEDRELMLNKLTTNYTYFMREEAHFKLFSETILPYLEQTKKDKVLSIWSTGCSSGEEPYTISIILKEYFANKPGWDTRVLATDISQNVLRSAVNAVYDEDSLKELSPAWKKKYFRPGDAPGTYHVTQELRNNVIFRTFNLMDPIKFRLKFDVIFCRNVMIYFDQETKEALVKRFFDATNDGGYLLIGHSEGLNKATTPYKYLKPATYRKVK